MTSVWCVCLKEPGIDEYIKLLRFVRSSDEIKQVLLGEDIDTNVDMCIECTKETLDQLCEKFDFERITDPDTIQAEENQKKKLFDNVFLQIIR